MGHFVNESFQAIGCSGTDKNEQQRMEQIQQHKNLETVM